MKIRGDVNHDTPWGKAIATHVDEDDSLKQGLIDLVGRTQKADDDYYPRGCQNHRRESRQWFELQFECRHRQRVGVQKR
ncbi:MAG: hypothetical protein K5683_09335 [Prevotella sp.]|nr:hypothetical protein [Prevotella sp.]